MMGFRSLWRWFTSQTVRRALHRHRHLRNLLRAQRDLLPVEAVAALQTALGRLRESIRMGGSRVSLLEALAEVELLASERMVDPSESQVHELCEMLLIALIVVVGLRTFGVQPMQIPTPSMQPTLYGVTTEDLRANPEARIPHGLGAWSERFLFGRVYYEVIAQADGVLGQVSPPEPIRPYLGALPFRTQRFQVGSVWYTVSLPHEELPNPFELPQEFLFLQHAGVRPDHVYRRGEAIVRMAVTSGDHILVDRFTYNFRRPARGEIVVFATQGVPALQEGTHYIKRLVGLPGDRLSLGDDRHMVVNGRRLDASTPHFENVYSFSGPPAENRYSGHVNDKVAMDNGQRRGTLSPLFPAEAEGKVFTVHAAHYLVLGDNTMNSYDGRRWGDFPQENIHGRFLWVYWPITERFGWAPD